MFPFNRFIAFAISCLMLALAVLFIFGQHYLARHVALAAATVGTYILLLGLIILDAMTTTARRAVLRRIVPWFGLFAAAAYVSGCSALGLTGAGGSAAQTAILDTAKAIAQDPNCGHTDRLAVNLGAISTGQLFLERNCPGPSGTVKTALPPVVAPAQ